MANDSGGGNGPCHCCNSLWVDIVLVLIAFLLLLSGCATREPALENKPISQEGPALSEKVAIQRIIAKEERNKGIPRGILNSIAAVESRHTAYAGNAKRKAHRFKTKEEAANFIKKSVREGCTNISVGCLQLHYLTHKENFFSLDDMLTIESNISYAARLLRALYDRHGNWETAIRRYHNGKAKHNTIYYLRVMRAYNAMYGIS